MFRTLTAKFPGRCRRCNDPFPVGTKIRYGGPGRTYHLKADCPASAPVDATDGEVARFNHLPVNDADAREEHAIDARMSLSEMAKALDAGGHV